MNVYHEAIIICSTVVNKHSARFNNKEFCIFMKMGIYVIRMSLLIDWPHTELTWSSCPSSLCFFLRYKLKLYYIIMQLYFILKMAII